MRDEKEERKKQARSNKQTRQSNTAHPRQSLYMYMYIYDVQVNTCTYCTSVSCDVCDRCGVCRRVSAGVEGGGGGGDEGMVKELVSGRAKELISVQTLVEEISEVIGKMVRDGGRVGDLQLTSG